MSADNLENCCRAVEACPKVNAVSEVQHPLFAACEGMEDRVTNCYYGRTNLYIGNGAIHKFAEIVDMYKITNVGVVSGRKGYKACGAWDVLANIMKEDVKYVHFDQFSANPKTSDIDNCVAVFAQASVEHILAIGGGSAIDGAKSVAILLANPGAGRARDLYEQKLNHLTVAKPIIAVNTTHGTGTEVDRFAIATIDEGDEWVKPVIALSCLYPLASIDDPAMAYSLDAKQTAWTTIDALNHVMESVTSAASNPFSVMLGRHVYEIAAKYLPRAMNDPNDMQARYWLFYGATIAGMCFDAGLLHLTHALEHSLSAIKPDLAHGLGLAVIQPTILRRIYPAVAPTLAYVMQPLITTRLKGVPGEADVIAKEYEMWMRGVGVGEKLADIGFGTDADCERLADNALNAPFIPVLIGLAPIKADRDVIVGIFKESRIAYNN